MRSSTVKLEDAYVPTVTVVIIVFNDVDLIGVAIESAQSQSLRDIEIVVVDHGSTDGTDRVIEEYAAEDERIRTITLPDNEGGPGRPLNAGIEAATGDWVTIVGSDDELHPDACRLMYEKAENSEVDVVLGKVARVFTEQNNRTLYWKKNLFRQQRRVGSIIDEPRLIDDTISAGKLYRRSLLSKHSLRFPADILYEDQLFTLQVYFYARGILIVPDVVYYWNSRPEAAKKSITSSRHSIENFEDRIEVNRRIDSFLEQVDSPVLMNHKREKFLRHDLSIYLNNFEEEGLEYRERFVACSRDYLQDVAQNSALAVHPLLKVIVALLLNDRPNDAILAHQYRNNRIALPVVPARIDDRYYWLDADEIRASGLDRSWFDITALGLHELPMSRRRLTLATREARVADGQFRLEVRVVERAGGFAEEPHEIDVIFRRRRDRQELVFPTTWTRLNEREVAVEFVTGAEIDLPGDVKYHENWDLWVRICVGRSVNVSRVPYPAADSPRGELKIGAGSRSLAANQLTFVSTSKGNLTLRAEPAGRKSTAVAWRIARTRKTIDRLGSKVERPLSAFAVSRVGKSIDRRVRVAANEIARLRRSGRLSVLFDSHQGRAYSGGPRAISELLHERNPEIEQYWTFRSSSAADRLPAYVKPVRYGSIRHQHALGECRVWVDDSDLGVTARRDADTWHIRVWDGPSSVSRNSADIDFIASPGRSFGALDANSAPGHVSMGGWVTEVLSRKEGKLPMELRQELGLPLNRRLMMYLPGQRSPETITADLANPEFEVIADALQEEWFVLNRNHYLNRAMKVPRDLRQFMRDLSRHPFAEDLLSLADVLVTDEPSAIINAVQLDKPCVIYLTSWNARGFAATTELRHLIDAGVAPVAANEEELIRVLGDFENEWTRVSDTRNRFRDEYGLHDQGPGAAKVVDTIVGIKV